MSTITDNINKECYSSLSKYLYQECEITALEDQSGVITAIGLFHTGLQFKVRYFIDGQYKEEWFYDFDIEFKDPGQIIMKHIGVQ